MFKLKYIKRNSCFCRDCVNLCPTGALSTTEEEMMVPVPAAVVGDIMKQKTGDYRFICNEKVVLSISEQPPYFHELLSMNRSEEWGGIVKQMSSKMEQARKMRQPR